MMSSTRSRGEAVTTQAAAGVSDVDAAVDAAHAAFPAWAATAPGERRAILEKAGELLTERAPDIARAMCEETAATFGVGMFNCALAAGMFAAAAVEAEAVMTAPVESHVPGLDSRAVRQPLGVCVGIAPWNAPVILGSRAVIWPLAFGNTVVLKASEQSPRVHGAIVQCLVDAGIPDGVVNLITNDPKDAGAVVGALIENPHVDPRQFHRLVEGRGDHRRQGGAAAQAHAAGARRQGAAGGARRCRP